ncbi:MAG: peptidase, partial [Sphingomonas bacterium]|nr:peptidase [Sphingomonas bacterium]
MTKLAMRRAWFQVHKWIGLILAILIIPLSVTGAALVWDDALDRGLNPQRYAVSGGAAIDTQAYVDAAHAALKPGENIATMSRDDDGPVVIAANLPAKRQANGIQAAGPPSRTTLWLDPPSARLLDRASGNNGLIRAMHQIHGSLMIPGAGRAIVGWIGVAMAFSCFTGLWLWW